MKYLSFYLFSFFLAITAFSCSKSLYNDDNDYLAAAYVGVVHAAAGRGALDIALDKNRLGLQYFTYTDRLEYFRAYTGIRRFSVYNAGSNDTLLAKNLTFDEGKSYSVFIVTAGANMDAVLIRDSSRAPGMDSARIRFANMSPDAPSLDLYVKGKSTPIARSISYKNAGAFFSYQATPNVVFEVRRSGQSALLATSDAMNLYNGQFYTIWTAGSISGNDAAGTRIRLEAFSH